MINPHEEHKGKLHRKVNFSIITVSTTRAKAFHEGKHIEDTSGDVAKSLIESQGHKIVYRSIIPDDILAIRNVLFESINAKADIVIFIGGTGITRDDVTIEALQPLFWKELPGFGEIMRFLSYKQIGASAFLSRAIAGIIGKTAVFCIPGSPNAVKLAVQELILPEADHIVYLLEREEMG